MRMQHRSFWIAFMLGMSQTAIVVGAPAEEDLPPAPSILHDVNLIHEKQYSRPQIPALRTTSDGRVALQTRTRTKRATEDVFKFFLFSPEKITRSFPASPKGTSILASTTPVALPRSRFVDTRDAGESIHSAICESAPLPSTCRTNSGSDCYNFYVVTPFHNSTKNQMEFWRTPVEVEISEPKTANARIAAIRTEKPIMGAAWPNISSMLETVVTADGRLLVGRVANNTVTWTDTNSGNRQSSQPNVVYGYIPKNSDACDVGKLRGPYPITHAHYHTAIRNNYGFAAYPLRDGGGRLIPNGADFGGSYPWIDSKGNNLFFGTFQQSMLVNGLPDFDVRCVGGGTCNRPGEEMTKDTMGVSVAGLWTKGRTVLLDNALNNVDWNLKASPDGHVEAKLYQGETGWVHVGTGRDNAGDTASHIPPGGIGNINFFDSIENKLNAFASMRPSLPRDVAWWVSNGKSTDIVAFDDWLNPYVLINSDMVQSIEGTRLEPDNRHVQNAASSGLFNAPGYGEIVGPGRIEPVALGGIRGKGFYRKSGAGIRYRLTQSGGQNLQAQDWYLGVFVDPRFDDDSQMRRLIEFPDGSAIDVLGHRQVIYSAGASRQQAISLPQSLSKNRYQHLGFRIKQDGDLELFVNGTLANRWKRPTTWANTFLMKEGDLWLGRGSGQQAGFTGWLDEFKVIAQANRMSPEAFCNHASGSIVGVTSQASSTLRSLAATVPAVGRELISQSLALRYQQSAYLCYTANRSADGWVDLNSLPSGVVSLREPILFPEGPLVAGQPRPDSSKNQFCLSCHQGDGTSFLPASLTTLALTRGSGNVETDARRQPSQPPRRMRGNIPAHLFGQENPPYHQSSNEGILVDQYLLQGD